MNKLLILGVLNTFFLCVSGYGYKMHTHLGKLTDNYLEKVEPELYNKVMNLLDGESISSVSSWADKVKRNKKYLWTKNLHFIDIMECRKDNYGKDTIDKYCKDNCIVSALQDFINSIRFNFNYDYITDDGETLSNKELLKFIIHFMQDFSQPMHLLGYERGGNSFKVNVFKDGKIKKSNLHYIWDSMLPEYFVKNYDYSFKYKNIMKPDNYYEIIQDILNENIHISCRIYPDSHDIIFDEYFNEKYFVSLFDNYQNLMINILKYIFDM